MDLTPYVGPQGNVNRIRAMHAFGPYGSGSLEVEFKGDLAAFSGTWKVKDMPDQGGNWSGARQ